jgi:hypothetical protein
VQDPPQYDGPEVQLERRRSIRAMQPLHRRIFGLIADVKVFAGICAATIAGHAWLKGLVTRAEVNLAVKAEVTLQVKAALDEMRADLAIIKTNTGGLPEWRGQTSDRVVKLEEKADEAKHLATKANDRIDSYLVTVRIHR